MDITNFNTIKSLILENIKNTEFCENYSEICSSIDYQSLFSASCGSFAWAYQAILSDSDVSSIPEDEMNSYGIYTSNVSLTNPNNYQGCKDYTIDDEESPQYAQQLFFLINSNSSININGDKKYIIYVMGNANLSISISDCSSCKIYVFNSSECNINASGNSSIKIKSNNNSVSVISAINNSKIYIESRGFSNVSYSGSETSSCIAKTFTKSIFSYLLTDSAEIFLEQNNKSTISNLSP